MLWCIHQKYCLIYKNGLNLGVCFVLFCIQGFGSKKIHVSFWSLGNNSSMWSHRKLQPIKNWTEWITVLECSQKKKQNQWKQIVPAYFAQICLEQNDFLQYKFVDTFYTSEKNTWFITYMSHEVLPPPSSSFLLLPPPSSSFLLLPPPSCHFFRARPGEEEQYIISTFSHSQSDAISNHCYRARKCHTACSYRVASLRNKHLALKKKEQKMKQGWEPKILLIQDEISLVPTEQKVSNMSVDLQSVQPSLIPIDRSADKRWNPNTEYNLRKFALSHTEANSASTPTLKQLWLPTCQSILEDKQGALCAKDLPLSQSYPVKWDFPVCGHASA